MKLNKLNYNGGDIWINKESVVFQGDWYWHELQPKIIFKAELPEPFKNATQETIDSCHTIVAQSITNPSYIDGVPFVEVGEDVEKLSHDFAMELSSRSTQPYNLLKLGFSKGYKAAQAKQFTEGELEVALFRMYKQFSTGEAKGKGFRDFTNEIINSLKPKVSSIEIEIINESDYIKSRPTVFPKTYQKDGKTFLKVKQ